MSTTDPQATPMAERRRRLGDRCHIRSLGYEEGTATENEAQAIFRSFPMDQVIAFYRPQLLLPELAETVVSRYNSSEFFRMKDLGEYPPATITGLLTTTPDTFALYHLITAIDHEAIVKAFQGRFRALIHRPDEPLDEMYDEGRMAGPVAKNLEIGLHLAVWAAVIRPGDRLTALASDRVGRGLTAREVAQIIERTPYIGNCPTPGARLDALIDMLCLTPRAAVAAVCADKGMTLAEYQERLDPAAHTAIGQEAMWLYTHFSLGAVFDDLAGEGYGSVFRAAPGTTAKTELKRCPANDFAVMSLRAIGFALRDEGQRILELLTTFRRDRDPSIHGYEIPQRALDIIPDRGIEATCPMTHDVDLPPRTQTTAMRECCREVTRIPGLLELCRDVRGAEEQSGVPPAPAPPLSAPDGKGMDGGLL